MKVAVALFAFLAAANAGVIAPAVVPAAIPATTLVRTPSLDSAVIKSDRLGGNFAYSTVEGHAYAAVSPVVQNVVSPVAVSYSATPVATPVNVLQQRVIAPQIIAPQYYPAQYFAPGQAIIADQQVIAPVVPGITAPSFPTISAPSFPIFPTDNLVPAAPAEEKPAEAVAVVDPAPIAPAEVSPAEPIPAEAPQADQVSVEAV